MRSETKLVKTASRSALAGGGERDRLLDDYQAPEAGWLVSNNRLGQASEPPDSSPRREMDGQHLRAAKRSSCTAAAARQAAGDLAPMSLTP